MPAADRAYFSELGRHMQMAGLIRQYHQRTAAHSNGSIWESFSVTLLEERRPASDCRFDLASMYVMRIDGSYRLYRIDHASNTEPLITKGAAQKVGERIVQEAVRAARWGLPIAA